MTTDTLIIRPKVSIVVLNYNGEPYVVECIESILNTSYPNFEIIFIDNASVDSSPEKVRQKFGRDPRVRIIINESNIGVTRGHNKGIAKADGKYVVLMDNDVKVEKNWLEKLVSIMESDESIGGAQPKYLWWDDPMRIDHAGCMLDILGFAYDRGKSYKNAGREIDAGQYNVVEEIFSASCTASIWRKSALIKVGGFDPMFFLGHEDSDLSWRVRLAGYKIVFVPSSIVYHKRSASSGKGENLIGFYSFQVQYQYHFCKNHIVMVFKNYGFKNLLVALPLVLIIYVLGVSYSLFFKRDVRSRALIPAVPRAFMWFIKNIQYVSKQRALVQRNRKVSDQEILKRMSKKSLLAFSRIK
jgi:GT2 family glycosyltransferase